MPTYEYICDACNHEFEQFQSITAPAIRTCPTCKKKKVRRKISSGAGILFKGGGFYETDYRSKGYADAAKKDAPSSADSSAKSDTSTADAKTDAKPAAAASDKPASAPVKTEAKAPKGKRGKE